MNFVVYDLVPLLKFLAALLAGSLLNLLKGSLPQLGSIDTAWQFGSICDRALNWLFFFTVRCF